MKPAIGTVGDRFVIEQEIAATDMSTVFRARDSQSGMPVALKIMARSTPRAVERFIREARLLATVSHPGIVQYIAHGTVSDGALYLATEWLVGMDLRQYLELRGSRSSPGIASDSDRQAAAGFNNPNGCLSVPETLILARRLVSAVAELHKYGIVHRDIKPSNLFLCNNELAQVKLLDLGTARRQSIDERVTSTGMAVGTPQYMAPEQARAMHTIGPPADVWGIGIVLYRCLAGTTPFQGDNLFDVLAKIVFEEPTPLSVHRSDVPLRLDALIRRMLAKEADSRPSSAHELVPEIEKILDELGSEILQPATQAQATWMSGVESRVRCILFAVPTSESSNQQEEITRVVAQHRGMLQKLINDSFVITVPELFEPTDQANTIAQAALALRAKCPDLRLSIVTARVQGQQLSPSEEKMGWVSDVLSSQYPAGIRVDSIVASLLDSHFQIAKQDGGYLLLESRAEETVRTLLGQPSTWVGRQGELSSLLATFEECTEDEVARTVVITGPAGMGKSRLRYEFEQALKRRAEPVTMFRCSGERLSAGSSLALLGKAIRSSANIIDDEPLESKCQKLTARIKESVHDADRLERIAVFLGEIAGVAFPDRDNESLRAARATPMFMGQQMKRAWLDWLTAECDRRPVLFQIEDLQWGDLPSVEYIDTALQALQDKPFMLVALARPEVYDTFPKLWVQHSLQKLSLRPLSPKVSTELVRSVLGHDISVTLVDTIVSRANGNAFYLEELIRAVAEGSINSLPDTVVGMVQARLDALGREAKIIVCAASIFGEVFWKEGIEALLAGERTVFNINEWLNEMTSRELISHQARSRFTGKTEYVFRHALMRDGAYEMLSDDDRRAGHAIVGQWLESCGEQDAKSLAEHFLLGGLVRRAVPYFASAAEHALESNDLRAVIEVAERAVQSGAEGSWIGRCRTLQAVASMWIGDYPGVERYARDAVEHLEIGSADWFQAIGTLCISYTRIGNHAGWEECFRQALEAPCQPNAEKDLVLCLCRTVFGSEFLDDFSLIDQALERAHAVTSTLDTLDAATRALLFESDGMRRNLAGDHYQCLQRLKVAIAEYEKAGDFRNVCMLLSISAWVYAEAGAPELAERICCDNLVRCERMGLPKQVYSYTQAILAIVISYDEHRLEEARPLLQASIDWYEREGQSLRVLITLLTCLAWVEYLQGNYQQAIVISQRAVSVGSKSQGFEQHYSHALAVHALVLLELEQTEESLDAAHRAMTVLNRFGGLMIGQRTPPLALAEALRRAGDIVGSRDAIENAYQRLEAQATRIEDSGWRERFWQFPECRKTAKLAADWNVR